MLRADWRASGGSVSKLGCRPWWWFAQVKILGEFYNTTIPCLDPCAGPDHYVDNLNKAGNISEVKVFFQQWIAPCYDGILDMGFFKKNHFPRRFMPRCDSLHSPCPRTRALLGAGLGLILIGVMSVV